MTSTGAVIYYLLPREIESQISIPVLLTLVENILKSRVRIAVVDDQTRLTKVLYALVSVI